MRLVVATCTVDYAGRLAAHLPEATRLLVVKADGTVLIHADAGSKALNWMSAPCRLVEAPGRWTVTGAKGERLEIAIAGSAEASPCSMRRAFSSMSMAASPPTSPTWVSCS